MATDGKIQPLKFIKFVIFFVVVILLGIYLVIVYSFVGQTTGIFKTNKDFQCGGSDYCVYVITVYDNGWGRWKLPLINLPVLSFTANSSAYHDGDQLSLICPIPYQNGDNKLFDEIKFLFGQVDINKCTVSLYKSSKPPYPNV